MRTRWTVVSLILLVVSATRTFCQEHGIDQMQPILDGTVGGLVIGGASGQKLAQVVTAQVSGDMNALFLPLACTSGKLTVDIRDVVGDEPGGTRLIRNKILAADLPAVGLAFRRIPLGATFHVSAGDRFALVLSNPLGECGIFQGPLGDSYLGGELFFDALPNAPGFIRVFPVRDLPFMQLLTVP